ncbi:MAG: DUF4139 domain-containing protein [Bacteroidota bacterium]
MKNLITWLGCIFALQAFGLEAEKLTKTKPEKIVIYTQGAQIHRSTSVSLVAGQNKIVFSGLENCINPDAIQASGNGNFIITDIQHMVNYPELDKAKLQGDLRYKKLVKTISDSLSEVSLQVEELMIKSDALITEKNVLLSYGLYKGQSKKDSIPFLKDGLTFLREKLYNINSEQLKIRREKDKLDNLKKQLNERMNNIVAELNNVNGLADEQKVDYRIIVNIIADQATQGTVNLNYYVTMAGWSLAYDLRATSNESNIKLTYKALIHQQSGVDWNNVRLVLSTANPNQTYSIPTLSPWYLGYHKPYTDKRKYVTSSGAPATVSKTEDALGYQDSEQNALALQANDYTTVSENFIETEYEIKLNYNIPSDNKDHYAAIMVKDMKTMFRYKAVPKINNQVYLTAVLPDWEEAITMGGEASIFYDGTFVGQTNLAPGGTDDTLQLPLGIDKNLAIKRVKIKDKCTQKLLDNDVIHNYAYEINIKNNRNLKIEIEVLDQLPLSNNKQITIEQKEISGAKYNELTGELKWRTFVSSKDSKKLVLNYQVKSPKNLGLAYN